jgi:activator of HSP90 ATPase
MKSASNQIQQILNSPLRFHELSTIELDLQLGPSSSRSTINSSNVPFAQLRSPTDRERHRIMSGNTSSVLHTTIVCPVKRLSNTSNPQAIVDVWSVTANSTALGYNSPIISIVSIDRYVNKPPKTAWRLRESDPHRRDVAFEPMWSPDGYS